MNPLHSSCLRFLSFNANGLKRQMSELRDFVINRPVELILIQEVKNLTKRGLSLCNYSMYFTPRIDNGEPSRFGGTSVYVRNNISSCLVPVNNLNTIEVTACRISVSHSHIFVVSFYARHGGSVANFEADLTTLFSLGNNVIVIGDFNARHPAWNDLYTNNYGRIINNFCAQNNIAIHSTSTPTHISPDGDGSFIDFCLTKNIFFPSETEVITDFSSDHLPIMVSFSTNCHLPSILNPPRVDWAHYSRILADSAPPSISIISADELNTSVKTITDAINNAVNSSKIHPPDSPTDYALPFHLRQLIKYKNRTRKRWHLFRDPADRSLYNRLHRKVKEGIRDFNSNKWSSFVESLAPGSGSLWGFVRRIKRPFAPIPPLATASGDLVYDDKDKADVIAGIYENQFKPNPDVFCPETIDEVYDVNSDFLDSAPTQVIQPTNCNEIRDLIRKIPIRKAPGRDEISNRALKALPVSYLPVLVNIINAILLLGKFPESWKQAVILPIFKPGGVRSNPGDYRPISLLSSLSKLAEHIITDRLATFVDENNIIIPEQFGFRHKHSTTHQLLRMAEYISDGLSNRAHTGGLYLDIAKAFDRVWHSGLIYKLIQLQVPDKHIHLIHSYLSNRSFTVRHNKSYSDPKDICSGVPQGSKLGPLLFLLFINDIPRSPHTKLFLFADDTGIMAQNRNVRFMHRHLQRHIDTLIPWFTKWRIKINPNKSKAVCFSAARLPPPPLKLFGQPISFEKEVKYLGVYLDSRLTWKKQILYTVNKFKAAASNISFILRAPELDPATKRLLFSSLLQPVLLYGSSIWGSAAKSNIEILQRAQSRTLRSMVCAPWYFKNKVIHRELGIPPIRETIVKHASRFYDNLYSIPNEEIFSLPDYNVWEPRRPKSVLIMPPVLSYRDPDYLPP